MHELGLEAFIATGFNLKKHLGKYLQLDQREIDALISKGMNNMSSMHPGSFSDESLTGFYENEIGNRHLFDLASWHLGSAEYIADTIRLQNMFAFGKVLDFGGGIGTHAIAAAASTNVEHVYFVDLNPYNREFVSERANILGVSKSISVHRDLESIPDIKFDTLICLDVLEHLHDPSQQLLTFKSRLSDSAVAILNWYFFKGNEGEYPFHLDDKKMIENFFLTLQSNFIEIFHPYLITARCYMPMQSLSLS